MMNLCKIGPVLALLLVLGTAAAPAHAQERFSVGLRAGPVFPAGEVGEVSNAGATIAGALRLRFHPRLAARVDLAASFLEEGIGPGINFIHLTGGLEASLLGPFHGSSPFTLAATLGAGTSRFEVEAFAARSGPQRGETFIISERYFTVTGGLEGVYNFNPHLGVVVSGRAYVVFTDEEDTALLALISPEIDPFGTAWTFPLTVGLRLSM